MPDDLSLTTLAAVKLQLDPPPANGIASIVVDTPGTGYTTAIATLVDSSSQGSGCVLGTPVISGGGIVSIHIATVSGVVQRGRDYLTPSVVITGDGAGATAHATIGADAILSQIIRSASALIGQSANLTNIFDSGTSLPVERRNGNGKSKMMPNVLPIVSVSSVALVNPAVTLSLSDGNSMGFLYDESLVYLVGAIFPRGVQNVALTYRAGYSQTGAVAAMLEQACITTVAMWWKKRPHIDYMSESVNAGLGTHTYIVTDLSKEAWAAINQIKRVAPMLG